MSKSFRDIRRITRRLEIKNKSAGPWGEGKPEAKDGICPACGQYDVELDKFGFCREEDCRNDRLKKALQSGSAVRLSNGDIVWAHGKKIRN